MMEAKIQAAFKQLREAGFRLTEQREFIVRYLLKNRIEPTHPTAEMIYTDLKAQHPNVSLATVYNTLELLVQSKLLLAIDNKTDGKRHYDWFGVPHYHVVCTNCGKIVDAFNFETQDLPQLAQAATGYLPSSYHVEVHGVCPECQELLGLK
ncbi:MAG: transcriptional repressor [Lactobacillaceae bacterium]|jgi:Fur family peroxide stress response transcriptional regulator|nr:transcriptional repressor [Lactobacillaceae bacterium]